MSRHPRPIRAALLGLAAALAALPAAAGPAAAAPYEQISRADGPYGGAPLWGQETKGTALGDVGRFAGFERRPYAGYGDGSTTTGAVRDIVLDRTLDFGGGVQRVLGIDRAERRALIVRTRAGQRQVVAVPLPGGTPIVVAQIPAAVAAGVDGALSGDGRKAVVSIATQYGLPPAPATGTKVYDLTGGTPRVVRTLAPDGYVSFGVRAVSDDASAVVGFDANHGRTHLWAGGTDTVIGATNSEGTVDGAGTTAAWIEGYGETIVVRDLRRGTERRFPSQADLGSEVTVPWVGPGGTKILVAPSAPFGNAPVPARYLSPGTSGPGTWTPLTGRFATSVGVVSPAGARTLTRVQNQVAIAQLSGAHLLGANQGLSAAAYLGAGSFVGMCNEPAEFSVYLLRPTLWVGAPRRAVVTARAGGRVIASGTLSHALEPPFIPVGDDGGPEWGLTGTYDPATAGGVQLTATVTDPDGRVSTETWTEADEC